MQILPLRTRLLKDGDNLAAALIESGNIRPGDIVIVSSKVIATVEGSVINLTTLDASEKALEIAKSTGQDPRFVAAILKELERLNGRIVNRCPGALMTEVEPKGMTGSILIANAGLDQSNAGVDKAVGWPLDPVTSGGKLRAELEKALGGRIAVIVSDSCSLPRRKGVMAIALTVSGIEPLDSVEGTQDLFDRELRLTTEARADQLATAANAVMGNAAQSTPAAIIRDHGVPFSDFDGWVPGIPRNEDLFGKF